MSDTAVGSDTDLAATAFGHLASEVRVRILLALWTDGPSAFADLQSAVGVADSGKFNYHLDKLRGQYVWKTGDGYRLTAAGVRVAVVVFAGLLTRTEESESGRQTAPLAAACPECDDRIRVRYEHNAFHVECAPCDIQFNYGIFPPRGLEDRTVREGARAYAARVRREFSLAARGTCPYCTGRMESWLDPDPDWYLPVSAASECEGCGVYIESHVGLRLLGHPAVAGFLDRHRADATAPFWTFDWCLDPDAARLVAEEPRRAELTVPAGDERLVVTVADDLSVTESTRVRRR